MDLYNYIHEYFNHKPRVTFPYDNKELKKITDSNGLYVLFENGETYKGLDRIVRIGSHDGNNRLIKRLNNHFKSTNHRLSVFRKHIGRCFLNYYQDDYLDNWNKPFKTKVEKELHKGHVDLEYEKKYELLVSNHICDKFSFTLIPQIVEKVKRDIIEEGLISILSQSSNKCSSEKWLGNNHPDSRIRNAKIWNIEYLNGRQLNLKQFKELIEKR